MKLFKFFSLKWESAYKTNKRKNNKEQNISECRNFRDFYRIFGKKSIWVIKKQRERKIIFPSLFSEKRDYIRGAFNKFPDFFVQAFKIVIDSWKFSILLLYILWDDWPIFMISASNEQLQQQLEYTLLKPDCHSWWISKMQSGREDTLEERYAIKFCFKLGKNVTETYGMLQTAFGASCMNRASVFEWQS